MDPIATRDQTVRETREKLANLVLEIDPKASIHDFRMVQGTHNTNLIFDMVIPADSGLSIGEAKRAVAQLVQERMPGCQTVVYIDRDYTGK